MIETSIIVVNHNGKRFLKECFESIYSSEYPLDRLEVILVDNKSRDASVAFMQKNFPRTRIIRSKENNYCRANNMGIRAAKARKYLVLLNNDTVVHKDWLKELVRIAESGKRIGGVTSKLLFLRRRSIVQSTGLKQLKNHYWTDRDMNKRDSRIINRAGEVEAIPFTAALIKKECFEEVGLLDENFQMYLEDVDFSLRCRKKGWKLMFAPKSIVYHYFRGTGNKRLAQQQCEKNRLLLITKHFPDELAKELDSYVKKEKINALAYNKGIYIRKITKRDLLIHDLYRKIQRIGNDKFSLRVKLDQIQKEKKRIKDMLTKDIKVMEEQKRKVEQDNKRLLSTKNSMRTRLRKAGLELKDTRNRIKQKEEQLKDIFNSRGWKLLTTVHNIKNMGRRSDRSNIRKKEKKEKKKKYSEGKRKSRK